MPQKPNVLDDVAQDVCFSLILLSNSPQPSLQKPLPLIAEREKYYSNEDAIMLEDESGRIQLVGSALRRTIDSLSDEESTEERLPWADMLVTGIIMGALGFETPSGEFEVKDLCFAGMAPMMYKALKADVESMDVDGELLLFLGTRR